MAANPRTYTRKRKAVKKSIRRHKQKLAKRKGRKRG